MTLFVVKCQSGTFDPNKQPAGFKVISAIENRFFICECEEPPLEEAVVEFPQEQMDNFLFYLYPNGKKLWFDPFNGVVEFVDVGDNKGRKAINYSDAQLNAQLSITCWFALNVWLPDKQRMYSIPDDAILLQIDEVMALTDPDAARTYVKKNLYYNL